MSENIIKTSHRLTEHRVQVKAIQQLCFKYTVKYYKHAHSQRETERKRERERQRDRERERIGLILREIYPGSIFERNIIENHEISETLLAELKKKKEIISDKEFII